MKYFDSGPKSAVIPSGIPHRQPVAAGSLARNRAIVAQLRSATAPPNPAPGLNTGAAIKRPL